MKNKILFASIAIATFGQIQTVRMEFGKLPPSPEQKKIKQTLRGLKEKAMSYVGEETFKMIKDKFLTPIEQVSNENEIFKRKQKLMLSRLFEAATLIKLAINYKNTFEKNIIKKGLSPKNSLTAYLSRYILMQLLALYRLFNATETKYNGIITVTFDKPISIEFTMTQAQKPFTKESFIKERNFIIDPFPDVNVFAIDPFAPLIEFTPKEITDEERQELQKAIEAFDQAVRDQIKAML